MFVPPSVRSANAAPAAMAAFSIARVEHLAGPFDADLGHHLVVDRADDLGLDPAPLEDRELAFHDAEQFTASQLAFPVVCRHTPTVRRLPRILVAGGRDDRRRGSAGVGRCAGAARGGRCPRGPRTVTVPAGATVAGVRVRGAVPTHHRAALGRRLRGARPRRRRVHRAGLDRPHAARPVRVRGGAAGRRRVRPARRRSARRPHGRPRAPADDPASRRSSPAPAGAPTSRSSRGSPGLLRPARRRVRAPHGIRQSSYSAADVPSLIRGFYRFHVLSRGWFDIGYNYLVDRYGRIYEGRSGGITQNVRGAQVAGFNTGSAGRRADRELQLRRRPTDAQMAALRDVDRVAPRPRARRPARHARASISGGGDRYAAGAVVPVKAISGHRDVGSTDCPGTVMYAQAARPARRGRRAAAAADLRPRGRHRRTSTRLPACCRSGSPPACPPPRRGASPSPMPPAPRWPEWTRHRHRGRRHLDRAGAHLADRPSLDASRPVTARPAVGAFNDLAGAPSVDVLRGPRIAGAATRHRHRRVLADRLGAHLGGDHRPAGELVKVLDAGTRRPRGAQQLTWSGPERPLPRRAAHGPRGGRRRPSRCRSTSAAASCR